MVRLLVDLSDLEYPHEESKGIGGATQITVWYYTAPPTIQGIHAPYTRPRVLREEFSNLRSVRINLFYPCSARVRIGVKYGSSAINGRVRGMQVFRDARREPIVTQSRCHQD